MIDTAFLITAFATMLAALSVQFVIDGVRGTGLISTGLVS